MSDPLRRRQLLGAGAALALAAGGAALWRQPAPGPGDVTLWFSYGGKNRKVLLDLVDEFHRTQSDVRVHPTFQGDYFEGLIKLRTGLFVGSTPTITHVVGEVVPYLAESGALASLDGLGRDVLDDLDPALSQSGTFVDGDEQPLVSLPFNRSTPVAYYNKQLFAELRLEPPDSWEAMREVARKATLRRGDNTERWGFECPIDWWFWVALVGQAGGQVIEADGRVSLGDEAGIEALEHWQAMVLDDRSMRPPPGRDYNAWEATNNDFLAGRAAMIWTSTAFLRYLEDNATFDVGTARLPAGKRRSVPTGGTFFVMPRGLSEQQRASGLAFLRFMMRPAQANTWASRTGYMSVSKSGRAQLEDNGFFDSHPNDRVTIEQLRDALPWPWAPELFRVQREAVQPRLEQAVLERRDATEMLQQAKASLGNG